jgi:hypothetical protein
VDMFSLCMRGCEKVWNILEGVNQIWEGGKINGGRIGRKSTYSFNTCELFWARVIPFIPRF